METALSENASYSVEPKKAEAEKIKSIPNSFAWTLAQVPLLTLFIAVVSMQLFGLSLRTTGWIAIAIWFACNSALSYLDRHVILNAGFGAPHILIGILLPPVYLLMRLSGRNSAAGMGALWLVFALLTLLVPIGSEIDATDLEQSISKGQSTSNVKGIVSCPDGANSSAVAGATIDCSIQDSATGQSFKVPVTVDADRGEVSWQTQDPTGSASMPTQPTRTLGWSVVCLPRAIDAALSSVLPLPSVIGGGCLIPRGMPYRPNV